jgi:hypothetical protein
MYCTVMPAADAAERARERSCAPGGRVVPRTRIVTRLNKTRVGRNQKPGCAAKD